MKNKSLIAKAKILVRFSEVDSMGIVWHGNYIKYFEDGREAFGKKYGINNLAVLKEGFVAPVVKITCDYKKPLKYGETAIVEVRFINCESAKLKFEFKISLDQNKEVIATGETVQVFLNKKGELNLTSPAFFVKWKKNGEFFN